jgi:hypothetical protein
MTDLIERAHYDELEGRMVIQTTYDNSGVLEANKAAQNEAPEFGRYAGNLVHAARVHMGDVVRLKNLGYDLLSPDPAEVRRALCYMQSEERHLLTVPGNPFAKTRNKWV